MTEAEWLACVEPNKMDMMLGSTVSHRKMRLFAVACCRRIWPLLHDERSRNAVDRAEELAGDRTKFRFRGDDPVGRAAYAVVTEAVHAYRTARWNEDEDWDGENEIDPHRSAAYAAYDAYAYSRPPGYGAAACAVGEIQ